MILLLKILLLSTLSTQAKSTIDYKSTSKDNINEKIRIIKISPIIDKKINALKILENKCNVCHIKRNRRRVFTYEKMDDWTQAVYKQVFIKKRMPRGKKNKLTTEEYKILLKWIETTQVKL